MMRLLNLSAYLKYEKIESQRVTVVAGYAGFHLISWLVLSRPL